MLRGQVKGAARGRQDAQVGAGHQERPDEVGCGLGKGGGQIAARVTGDHSGASDGVEQDPDQISSG